MSWIGEWFLVRFDEQRIELDVRPPGREAWQAATEWKSILRVCFETTDFVSPDTIYLFVEGREASYTIPTEATGGLELWNELIHRKLFDAELAIEAASTIGKLFCWPPGGSE